MANRNAASALPWYRQAPKVVAAAASTGAACVSVFTFLYSFGVVGESKTVNGVGGLGVAWVGIRPATDTARAIGDTLHLAATITDKSGAVLLNTRPSWSSDDPSVATVEPDGSVIARGAGATTITVAVGSVIARSRIVVHQQVATVAITGPSTGGNFVMSEGERRVAHAQARDARGHVVAHLPAVWTTEDSTVASVDSTGAIVGGMPGRTRIGAGIAGVNGHLAVHVVASPSSVTLVTGDTQHVEAGRTLPQPIVVRVASRRGLPIAGVPVRFRSPHGGLSTPASVMSDGDGRARTTWTLHDQPGRQLLLASADGVDSALVVAAEADPSPSNTRVTPMVEELNGVVGAALAQPVTIQVTDSAGRLLGDIPVSWLATDGAVRPLARRTDSLGMARAEWTLGRKAGEHRLQVNVGSARSAAPVPPLLLRAVATPGAPHRVVVAGGDAQRGPTGSALRRPVVLRTVDSLGNTVPNAPILLSGLGRPGADSAMRSDSTGLVAVAWTLGPSAGTQRLLARIPRSSDSVVVTAVARAAATAPAPARQAGSPRPAPKARSRRGG